MWCALLLHMSVGVGPGVVHGTSWELEKVRGNGVMAMLTLAIISVVAALQVFGKDRLVFWRESESGTPPGHTTLGLGSSGFRAWFYDAQIQHHQYLVLVHSQALVLVHSHNQLHCSDSACTPPHLFTCCGLHTRDRRRGASEGRGGGGARGICKVYRHSAYENIHMCCLVHHIPSCCAALAVSKCDCDLLLQGCTPLPSSSAMQPCT